MYVLARDVEKDGVVFPKGTPIPTLYLLIDGDTLGAVIPLQGERHKITLQKSDVGWKS